MSFPLRVLNALLAFALVTVLVSGCGGGSGYDGSPPPSGGTPGSGGGGVGDGDAGGCSSCDVAQAASVTLLANNSQLASSGAAPVVLTALVKDANNVLLENVPVTFSASSGALQVTRRTTDASGAATATLTTGGDPVNRTIHTSAVVGQAAAQLSIDVTGTQLSISGPRTLVAGSDGNYTISLKDSDGNGIPDRTVVVSSAQSNPLSSTSLTSNSAGQASVRLTASSSAADVLVSQAAGLTSELAIDVSPDHFRVTAPEAGAELPLNQPVDVVVEWSVSGGPVSGGDVRLTSTRGGLNADVTTDGAGHASATFQSSNAGPALIKASVADGPEAEVLVEFVATNAHEINLQASPSSIGPNGRSTLTAVVRDENNNLVKNQVVTFRIVEDVSGGALNLTDAITDSFGRASVEYTAGDTTSGSEGVQIEASVGGISADAALTVGQRALRITLGTGNTIETSEEIKYSDPWLVLVTDANGNPVADRAIQLSAHAWYYAKGVRLWDGSAWVAVKAVDNCVSEDRLLGNPHTDFNGMLDDGEDHNGDGRLTPSNPVAVPGQVTTDATGFAYFDVSYAKDQADWIYLRLQARAEVDGTEAVEEAYFWLKVAAADVQNEGRGPPGQVSPYGKAADCSDPS